jgi:hypothetical protein
VATIAMAMDRGRLREPQSGRPRLVRWDTHGMMLPVFRWSASVAARCASSTPPELWRHGERAAVAALRGAGSRWTVPALAPRSHLSRAPPDIIIPPEPSRSRPGRLPEQAVPVASKPAFHLRPALGTL